MTMTHQLTNNFAAAADINFYHAFVQGVVVIIAMLLALIIAIPAWCKWLGEVLEAHSLAVKELWSGIGAAGRAYREVWRMERAGRGIDTSTLALPPGYTTEEEYKTAMHNVASAQQWKDFQSTQWKEWVNRSK